MVIIAESVCCGNEHATVNAAFIAALNNSFSDDEIFFIGQKAHIENVISALPKNLQLKVQYRSIKIPSSGASQRNRAIPDIINITHILSIARSLNVKKVFFSSISSSGILFLNFLIIFYPSIMPIVVLHRTLESITHHPSLLPWKFLFWYGFVFRVARNKYVRYLVLGESIKNNFIKYMPRLETKILSIDMPYFFNNSMKSSNSRTHTLKFAALGVGSIEKNTHLFFQMAKEIVAKKTILKPEFFLIGHIVDQNLRANLEKSLVIAPSPNVAMPIEKYRELLNNIDYVVFLFNSTSYRLSASAALFDAFAALKPIIANKTDFFQYYFNKMGNIGFLCNDFEEVKSRILNLLNKENPDEYETQFENIYIQRTGIDTICNRGMSQLWE